MSEFVILFWIEELIRGRGIKLSNNYYYNLALEIKMH